VIFAAKIEQLTQRQWYQLFENGDEATGVLAFFFLIILSCRRPSASPEAWKIT